jgi:hypothetical protein
MCRGLGRVQLRTLRVMRPGRYFTTDVLARAVYDHAPVHVSAADAPTVAELTSIRRALSGLEKIGRVHRHGRQWTRDRGRVLKDKIRVNHYLRSVPSRPVEVFEYESAILVFAIPANRHLSQWLLGKPNAVLELSRMWAPDGHAPNLLTRALAQAIRMLRQKHPQCEALISYADPNNGHHGGVYRAACWVPLGCADETRYYSAPDGTPVSRRRFHSGSKGRDSKAAIAAAGYIEERRPSKLRFAKGLTPTARQLIAKKVSGTAPAEAAALVANATSSGHLRNAKPR